MVATFKFYQNAKALQRNSKKISGRPLDRSGPSLKPLIENKNHVRKEYDAGIDTRSGGAEGPEWMKPDMEAVFLRDYFLAPLWSGSS